MALERILITVKTYPTLSRKYGETVCTAGLREDGTWVRIYPVPFRRLEEEQQYAKFDWLACGLIRNHKDPRPETYHPVDVNQLIPVGHLDTAHNWHARRRLVLGKARVFDRLDTLIAGAKSNQFSLAVFKPTSIADFTWEKEDPEWDPVKLATMRHHANGGELFAEETWRLTFKVIRKLPYSFSYRFVDAAGTRHELQILDWEAGALYWNCLASCQGDEAATLAKLRQRYFDDFTQKDLHFFLGTTQEFHFRAPNPWVIIGVFPIPHEHQPELF